ncbi:hypothetical protein [Streptomyces flaveus]
MTTVCTALGGTTHARKSIAFTFDAHLAAEHPMDPTKATGTFRFSSA